MSVFKTYIVHTNKQFIIVEKAVSKTNARKKIMHTLADDEFIIWVVEKRVNKDRT